MGVSAHYTPYLAKLIGLGITLQALMMIQAGCHMVLPYEKELTDAGQDMSQQLDRGMDAPPDQWSIDRFTEKDRAQERDLPQDEDAGLDASLSDASLSDAPLPDLVLADVMAPDLCVCQPGTTIACGPCNLGKQKCKADCTGYETACLDLPTDVCHPNSTIPCGPCGLGFQLCRPDCMGYESECLEVPEDACEQGSWLPCGPCGLGIQHCKDDCSGYESTCEGVPPNACESDTAIPCGLCGLGSQFCKDDCSGYELECTGVPTDACEPGTAITCGACNLGVQTCTQSCTWGICVSQAPCSPGQVQSCPNGCGQRTCTSECKWSSCSLAGNYLKPSGDMCWSSNHCYPDPGGKCVECWLLCDENGNTYKDAWCSSCQSCAGMNDAC